MKKVIEAVLSERIIMIVRGVPRDKIEELAEAMYRGGIRLMECTYDASGISPDEETAQTIATLAERFRDRMLIGAGTVLKPSQVELTEKAGGSFIISPDTNAEIIKKTVEMGLVSIPGALTPTEAAAASAHGAHFVKLFPVSAMGEGYVKAISAPLSNIRFLAVGGVRLNNLAHYLGEGASGVGIGLTSDDKEAIARGDFGYIEEKCRLYVAEAKKII